MAYQLKLNSGSLFENQRKNSDNHPDMTGKLNIDGVEHWFSGWWKSGNGSQFLSLSIGIPVNQQGQQPQERIQQPPSRGAAQRPGARPAPPPPQRQSRPPAQPQGYDDFQDEGPPF